MIVLEQAKNKSFRVSSPKKRPDSWINCPAGSFMRLLTPRRRVSVSKTS